MKEIWKDVVGYEGIYQVSNLGNVKRKYILKPHKDRRGYLFVNLSHNSKVLCSRVHRLVALAFIPNPLNKKEINHKNGNKLDNRVENLEWATHKENMKHAFSNHLISNEGIKRGVNAMLRATRKKVIQLKNGIAIKEYISVADAYRQTGIKHICCCANGKRKSAGGYKWEYVK